LIVPAGLSRGSRAEATTGGDRVSSSCAISGDAAVLPDVGAPVCPAHPQSVIIDDAAAQPVCADPYLVSARRVHSLSALVKQSKLVGVLISREPFGIARVPARPDSGAGIAWGRKRHLAGESRLL